MAAPSRIVRLLAVAVVTALALTVAPAPAATAAPTPAETKYGTKIFTIVNNIRDNRDRVELKRNRCLQRFANRQAERMANQRRLFHQNLGRIQKACGVGYVGENVAYGPFTARRMVNAWMNSPGHRSNILFRKYRITGVAARRGGGYWWAAQVFGRKG
jgi:uncharacterized protein YkwD